MRKLAAVGALLLTGLAGTASLPAVAGTTTYNISGNLAGSEANCTQVIFSFNASDCSYSNTRPDLTGTGWEGPPRANGFYQAGGPADGVVAYQNTAATPDTNLYAVPVTGTLVVDDNGTPNDPTDDKISFNWTIGAAVHNILVGNARGAVEKWTSVNEVMQATAVNAASAANASGGVDYLLTSQTPFPTPLHHTAALSRPGAPATYGTDADYPSATAPGGLGDPPPNKRGKGGTGPYYDAPSTTGIERSLNYAGNNGGVTAATFVGYSCIDTGTPEPPASNQAGPTANDCQVSPLLWGAPTTTGTLIDPNNPANNPYGQNPGWDNVIMKVSTDSTGAITSAIAYYTREFDIEGLGTPGPFPGSNSWQGGIVTFTAPVPATAVADAAQVAQDSSNNPLTVAANDIGFGDPVTLSVTVAPQHGTTTPSGAATVSGAAASVAINYTPTPGFNGTDTFTYQIQGNGGNPTKTGVVTVTVLAVGANNDTATTKKNTAVDIDVLANDVGLTYPIKQLQFTQPANGAVTLLGSLPGAKGTLKLHYVPTTGYSNNGSPTDNFTYTVTDQTNIPLTATVAVTVTNQVPVAKNVTVTTGQDVPKLVDLSAISGNKPGDAPATYTVTNPVNGTTGTVSGSSVTFTPTLYFTGTSSFDYTITDADGDVAGATVTLTVGPKLVPTAAGATLTVQQDTAGDATAAITLGSGALNLHTVTISSPASSGTCSTAGSPNSATTVIVHYVPNAGYSGSDSCSYTVKDANNNTATGVVSITVNKNQLVVTLPGGGGALDPVTLGLLALGVPVVLRRRRRHDA